MIDVEGFILAGGASNRMGRAKWQLRLGDETFLERTGFAMRTLCANGVSVIGSNLPEKINDLPVIPDQSNQKASIIGLYTALKHSKSEWSLIVACDLPFVSGDLFRRLAEFVEKSLNIDAVVPVQPDGRPQPLCAFYRHENCLPVVEKMLIENNWKLSAVLQNVNTRFVEFEELADLPNAEYFFFNVNTPNDYAVALKIAEK